jgi:2-polyprenyl-6-methoxyphenol hydroxylase-like FAD-dependent oxidoreductase
MQTADVLIAGAGPVGLTLALDLGRRGIATVLVEKRERALRLPKMERSNPRTMEIYRRLGIAETIRAAAYPADEPMDILVVRSMAMPPLVHQVYPTIAQARAQIAASRDGALPREPYQLVSQYTLEGLLEAELGNVPAVTIARGTELIGFEEEVEGVVADLRSGTGTTQLRARYLVGCDGAGSFVRDALGLELEGQTDLGTITNIFFRCDELLAKSRVPRARHYLFAGVDSGGGAGGAIVVQDDLRHFGCHLPVELEPDTNVSELLRGLTSLDVDPQVLFVGRWTQNMLVAEAHGRGRVFLAGDANHIYIPAGGLGMNTGIGDVANLAWKLAATLEGWGGPDLLPSYLAERQAVARRNIKAVAYAVEGVVSWRKLPVPKASEGATVLRAYAAAVEPLNRRVYEMHGVELGYRYESRVIWREPGEPSPDESYVYRPTTRPGAHLPHVWLEPGVALYDRIGSGYALLRLGACHADLSGFEAALQRRRIPHAIIDIPDPVIRRTLERDLILVRPDLHVAWRGNAAPADPDLVVAAVTGF